MGKQLFVVRHNYSKMDVYNTSMPLSASSFKPYLSINIVNLGPKLYGMTSCSAERLVFVSDYYNNAIHRVHVDKNKTLATKWSVGLQQHPVGMSMTSSKHVLVVCLATDSCQGEVHEYATRGTIVRKVVLRDNEVIRPWQAVEMEDGRYAVTERGNTGSRIPPCLVCIVTPETGAVERLQDDRHVPSVGRYLANPKPRGLAVGKSGTLVVGYRDNKFIAAMDPISHETRELIACSEIGLTEPSTIHVDEDTTQLIIADLSASRFAVLDWPL